MFSLIFAGFEKARVLMITLYAHCVCPDGHPCVGEPRSALPPTLAMDHNVARVQLISLIRQSVFLKVEFPETGFYCCALVCTHLTEIELCFFFLILLVYNECPVISYKNKASTYYRLPCVCALHTKIYSLLRLSLSLLSFASKKSFTHRELWLLLAAFR